MTIRSPPSSSITTRLPTRPTETIRRPTTRRRNAAPFGVTWIGRNRDLGSRTSRTVQPTIGNTPRRMVSTSGNSGIATRPYFPSFTSIKAAGSLRHFGSYSPHRHAFQYAAWRWKMPQLETLS